MVAAGGALCAISIIDLSLRGRDDMSAALVVVPFLASAGVRPPLVSLLGMMAAAATIILASVDTTNYDALGARVTVVLGGSLIAVRIASNRIRRDGRLVDLSTIAETTQSAILRRPPARVGLVAAATWYQSSVGSATVGGDCLEILSTPYGTRALVGDVRGHGMPSVRLAALILGAFRVLAHIEADLRNLAIELDRIASRYAHESGEEDVDGEEFVTAVLSQINGSTLTLANCGHPPPLLISPGGHVRRLEPTVRAQPLAIDSKPVPDTFVLSSGWRLLLYTDGVTEARDRAGRFFELESAAGATSEKGLEAAVTELVNRLSRHADGDLTDDVAVMLLERLDPHPDADPPGASDQLLTS